MMTNPNERTSDLLNERTSDLLNERTSDLLTSLVEQCRGYEAEIEHLTHQTQTSQCLCECWDSSGLIEMFGCCRICLKAEIERLRAINKAYRKPPEDFKKETIDFLVEVAFKAGEISHMRACELLGENIEDFKDRRWVQGDGLKGTEE